MKSINNYIFEKLIINKNTKILYNYFPETIDELDDIVEDLIKERGNNADLNDIDVSKITDFSFLFLNSKFNGNISNWNVSNAKTMYKMFYNSKFNGDISKWDVSNVEEFNYMFSYSVFNQDISKWNVSNVTDMKYIFYNTPLEDKEKEWWNK